jgi:hypothetical protein
MIYIFTQIKFSKDGKEIIRASTEGFHTDPNYFDKILMELSKKDAQSNFDDGWMDHAVVEVVESGFLKKTKVIQWYKLESEGLIKINPPFGWEKPTSAIYQF